MRGAALKLTVLSSLVLGSQLCFATDVAAQQPAPAQCTTPKTTCIGDGGYYASADDLARVTAVGEPLLKELRGCLDSVGGKHITPSFVIRWDSEGNAVSVKIDVPGYESQVCVTKVQAKLQTLQNPRETAIRCEYGCGKPQPSAPPVVVAPPVTTGTTPPPPPPPATPTPPEKKPDWHTEKVWYGWQTLTADGISYALMFAGAGAKVGSVFGIGYASFLLATPITHMVHGNIGPGFGSIAMRLFIPPILMLPGALIGLMVSGTDGSGKLGDYGDRGTGAINGAVIGFFVGAIACTLIDTGALAYTKERVDGPPPPSTGSSLKTRSTTAIATPARLKLSPTFSINRDQGMLGVGGSF